MSQRIHRRSFLGRAAAGLVILPAARSAWTYQANDKIRIALVGCGGRGEWFVDFVPKQERIVALCDVNDERAAASYRKLPDVPKHQDFRKMLDTQGKEIDAVIVAAPDHIHAPCTMLALKLGKHVYCEKPLTHGIREARVVREAAARSKVATQLGNQGTSSEAFRRAVELFRAGVIGEVREVHAWNEGGGPGRRERPREERPIPPTLQWDLWLGPCASRPFHPDWLQWHGWREFGTGQLGNWASHTMNLPFKALRLDELWDAGGSAEGRAIRVRAEVEEVTRDSFPRWEIIEYDFPARGALPSVKVRWYNGNRIPRGRKEIEDIVGRRLDWGDAGERKWADYAGCLLVGTKGIIHSTGHNMSFMLLPEAKFKDVPLPPPTLPRAPGHEAEWFRACRGGPTPMSCFEYGGRLAEFVHLGNIATLWPEGIEFDPVEARIVRPVEAGGALFREYRDGWSL